MDMQKLKNAIEFDKRCEELFDYDTIQKEHRKTLRDACQLLIDTSDKMEPKKAFFKRDFVKIVGGQKMYEEAKLKEEAYNLARSEDILWLTKKMMGLESVIILAIQNARTKGEFAKSPSLYFIGQKEVDLIANAIRQEMGEK